MGVDYGPLETEIKYELICELDAVISHLYGLNEKQLNHIFETFHKGWDYEEIRKSANYFIAIKMKIIWSIRFYR